MDRIAEVLFANEHFYQAFGTGDYQTMESLWAKGVPVTCIHPGHGPLMQRKEIMKSWKLILQGESASGLQCKGEEVMIHGDLAWVICYESLQGGYLIATNLFIQQNGEWKIMHHQAGPTSGRPSENEEISGEIN
ncbi:MAG: nuclear transport factor 2 family protein [SAR324 cluster bacterium]|nr:nuclear transport factor 2 family protein [SAR324 cluster bacterium]